MTISRRYFLQAAAALGASLACAGPAHRSRVRWQERRDLYPHGVASGDPAPDGFVIWTRLAPKPLEGGGMPETNVEVRWEVADDGLTIARTMTIHDDAYTAPLVRTRGSQRGNPAELVESPPCDSTTFYYELFENGELEERFEQL